MSYTFKEDSNENFVVVNLKSSFVRKILNRDMDGQQEIDLEEAIGAIEGSDVYNNPDGGRTIVKWFPGGVLAGDVNVVIGQDDPTPSDLLSVLSFVGDCQENAIFIVGLDVGNKKII